MEIQVEDLAKVGGSSMGVFGIVAFLSRFFRADIRRIEVTQAEVNKKLWQKTDALSNNLNEHRVEDAKAFVSRDEFSTFRTHIDEQFERTRNLLFELAKK